LGEDRREVLEGPLLADLAGIVDPVDVDGVPLQGLGIGTREAGAARASAGR
jgi:hypothetical protein